MCKFEASIWSSLSRPISYIIHCDIRFRNWSKKWCGFRVVTMIKILLLFNGPGRRFLIDLSAVNLLQQLLHSPGLVLQLCQPGLDLDLFFHLVSAIAYVANGYGEPPASESCLLSNSQCVNHLRNYLFRNIPNGKKLERLHTLNDSLQDELLHGLPLDDALPEDTPSFAKTLSKNSFLS